MSVIWAQVKGTHVFEVAASVERALGEVEAAPPPATQSEDLFMGDTYLAENVGQMRASWELDPWAVAPAGPGALGKAFDLGQRVVRRLTWWHTRPQLDQASRFNAAVVRVTDALLAQVLRLARRTHDLEMTHSEPRLRGFEEQLRLAREEQARLQQRIAQLEAEVALLKLG